MELRELITAIIGVANAVAYAHSRGVLHRDLKGQNVVLGDFGEVIVLDWGLACVIGAPVTDADQLPVSGSGISDQIHAGQIVGTPAYMSPEQAAGDHETLNAQTDVFGLGALLYELLTGESPFGCATVAETLVQAKSCNPVPPGSVLISREQSRTAVAHARAESQSSVRPRQSAGKALPCFLMKNARRISCEPTLHKPPKCSFMQEIMLPHSHLSKRRWNCRKQNPGKLICGPPNCWLNDLADTFTYSGQQRR